MKTATTTSRLGNPDNQRHLATPAVEPSETVQGSLTLTDAAEFTLELMGILRILAPLAKQSLERSTPSTQTTEAWDALRKANLIFEPSEDEEHNR